MKNIQESIWRQRKHKVHEFDGNSKLLLRSIIINFPKQNTFMKKVNESLIDCNFISILKLQKEIPQRLEKKRNSWIQDKQTKFGSHEFIPM